MDYLYKFSPYRMATLCKILYPKVSNSRPHIVRTKRIGTPYGKWEESLYKGY